MKMLNYLVALIVLLSVCPYDVEACANDMDTKNEKIEIVSDESKCFFAEKIGMKYYPFIYCMEIRISLFLYSRKQHNMSRLWICRKHYTHKPAR